MDAIYQCGDCLRYFTPDLAGDCFALLSSPLPAAGFVPEMCACGLLDCAEIARELAGEERRRQAAEGQPVAEFWRKKKEMRRSKIEDRRSKKKCAAARRSSNSQLRSPMPAGQCHRGMPPEREEIEDGRSKMGDRTPNSELPASNSIGSSQAEFHAAVDVSAANNVLLDYFIRHYGEWIPMVSLELLPGCHMVHSRVSEVRELLPPDQDIDQVNRMYAPTGRLHSHYRLCLKSESVRLQRKAVRDERQGEFIGGSGE